MATMTASYDAKDLPKIDSLSPRSRPRAIAFVLSFILSCSSARHNNRAAFVPGSCSTSNIPSTIGLGRSQQLQPLQSLYRLSTLRSHPSETTDKSESTTTPKLPLGTPICQYQTLTIEPTNTNPNDPQPTPRQAVSIEDLTPHIQSLLSQSQLREGVIHVISRHTTTAITINERESRLARDVENFFLNICPPDERSSSPKKQSGVRYLHNDIDQRPESEEEAQRCRDNGWDIDDTKPIAKGGGLRGLEQWRGQEPINAHSHLISMMLGSSECIPVVEGEMVIGEWQSVLLVDLDGPRRRTVGVQLMGYE